MGRRGDACEARFLRGDACEARFKREGGTRREKDEEWKEGGREGGLVVEEVGRGEERTVESAWTISRSRFMKRMEIRGEGLT